VPRPWPEYSAREWTRLRPLVERYKHAGHLARMAYHLRRPPAVGDLAALRARIAGRQALVAIAFEDPGFVARQVALVRRNTPGVVHLIVDNSTDDMAARQIEAVAAKAHVDYLKLHPGPWRRPEQGSRSHGLAMSWVWRNLIRPARPAAFGFIDHDIFPIRPTDPFAPLRDHLVAGQVRNRSGRDRWYLWAGFCFFRFGPVASRALDFSPDWAAGLDTGGANWFSLYRNLRAGQVFDAEMRHEPIPGDGGIDTRLEWIGDWLHAGNFSLSLSLPPDVRSGLIARKREALEARLGDALRDAGLEQRGEARR